MSGVAFRLKFALKNDPPFFEKRRLRQFSAELPPVTNIIYRSAVPPVRKYLLERRSAVFRHHYVP